jgi:predicted Zn-dependent peptidase
VTGAGVTEVLSELQRLSGGDVTEDEAASARAILAGDMLTAHTTMASTLNGWLTLWQQGALPSVYELYADALPGTTAAQLNELADDVLATEPILIVLVGDAEAFVPQLEGRGLPTPEWRDAAGRPVPAPRTLPTPPTPPTPEDEP